MAMAEICGELEASKSYPPAQRWTRRKVREGQYTRSNRLDNNIQDNMSKEMPNGGGGGGGGGGRGRGRNMRRLGLRY